MNLGVILALYLTIGSLVAALVRLAFWSLVNIHHKPTPPEAQAVVDRYGWPIVIAATILVWPYSVAHTIVHRNDHGRA